MVTLPSAHFCGVEDSVILLGQLLKLVICKHTIWFKIALIQNF